MVELRIDYVLRRPQYPLLCALGAELIAARTRGQLQQQLSVRELPTDATFPVVDCSGEGLGLYTNLMALSPMVMKKTWMKAELVSLYRASVVGRRHPDGRDDKAWLRLRLEEVISEIVSLIEKARTPNPGATPGGEGRR
jgi:hypothetical protein